MKKLLISFILLCGISTVYCQKYEIWSLENTQDNIGKIQENFKYIEANKADAATTADKTAVMIGTSTIESTYLQEAYYHGNDTSGYEILLASLTTNGAIHDLDLSAYIPVGTKAVLLLILIKDDAAGNILQIFKNGDDKRNNISQVITQVANVFISVDCTVAVDDDRIMSYFATNTTWTIIDIKIKGWFK